MSHSASTLDLGLWTLTHGADNRLQPPRDSHHRTCAGPAPAALGPETLGPRPSALDPETLGPRPLSTGGRNHLGTAPPRDSTMDVGTRLRLALGPGP
jgi:hypothetical protein